MQQPDRAPGPTKSGGGNGRQVALIGVGCLVAVGLVVGVVVAVQMLGGDEETQTVATSQSPSSGPSSSSSSSPPTEDPAAPQTNRGTDQDNAMFDVPPAGSYKAAHDKVMPIWDMPSDPRDLAGILPKGGSPVLGHGPTEYRPDYCAALKQGDLGTMVWANRHAEEPLGAASGEFRRWIDALGTTNDGKKEKIKENPPKSVVLTGHKVPAVQVTGTVAHTDSDAKSCNATGTELVVTAFETGKGTATMVAYRRTGHPDSIPDRQWNAILNSLRPAS